MSKQEAMSSPPTTPMSQASTRFGLDSLINLDDAKVVGRRVAKRAKQVPISQDVFLFLVAFRILNALSIKTFFQPDEYFQSLEPAWEIAFGANSGAWITWVSKSHSQQLLRPSLTQPTGMEASPPVRRTSSSVRFSLPDCVMPVLDLTTPSHLSRRSIDSCAQGFPSRCCCPWGLLYLEARRTGIRSFE